MSAELRRALKAWLEFAREMGVEALPRAAARGGAVPVAADRDEPEAPATRAAKPREAGTALAHAAAPARGPSPLERVRGSLQAGSAGAKRTAPPGAAPAAARSAGGAAERVAGEAAAGGGGSGAPSAAAGGGPRRLDVIPAELLAVPADRFAGAPADDSRPARSLEDVRALIGDCKRCKLHQGRTRLVFGVGDPNAALMFVGEGPGRDEDLQGEPFVGRAGQLLNDIIKAIGLAREQVYIANVVKCRPPENRTPERDEVEACRGFLFRQIALVRPAVIVALGKPAAETLLGKPVAISSVRGQVADFFGAKLVPTFHPAYLLRDPAKKREVWEDMKKVRDLLAGKAV